MASKLVTEWPTEQLMPMLKLAALFSIAQGQGLVTHFLFAGPTLVGEILAGFVCGPVIMNLVPTMIQELEVVGRIAMMVVLFERGLYTNFSSIAQCGAFGALMAILGIALPMTLVTVAMRVNGHPFIESLCAGCVMSTAMVGLVDIGWRRAQVKDINPHSTLASKLIDAGTTINSMLIMSVLSVMRSISPEATWYHPQKEWWVACQPMLFSLAFLAAAILMRSLFSFFCLKDVFGSFFPPKSDPTSELYNTLEFAQVTFMTAFALALGVTAEVVMMPALVGFFAAGICFGGSETCRESWDRNTRNLIHWLSRIFFTCSIGFIMPAYMGTKASVLDGMEVASAAFFGSFIAGAVGSLPVLFKEKNGVSNILLCGSAMAHGGEMGFIFLLEFWSAGYFSETTLAALLWGLLLGSVISPALCQMCIFVQHDPNDTAPGDVLAGSKYQLPDDVGGSSKEGTDLNSPLNKTDQSMDRENGMDTKASYFRNTMQYTSPAGGSDKEREVPLIYNAVSPMSYHFSPGGQRDNVFPAPYVPSPQEPSPTQAPVGPAGAVSRGIYGELGQSAQIIRPGLQASAQRSAPLHMATQDRGLPPTLKSTPNDMAGTQVNGGYLNGAPNLQATSGYASAVTPSNPISAVPINSQNRRTVPSIWADDD